MAELLKRLLNICLLIKGPQDIPYSPLLFQLLLLLYFISGVMSLLPTSTLVDAVLSMILDVFVLLSFSWLCLQAFKKLSRLLQMVTTLFGVGSIFQLLAWPLLVDIEAARQTGEMISVTPWLLLLLISWNLAVYAHVFRESFSINLLAAFVMTLAYAVISITSRQLLFPEIGA